MAQRSGRAGANRGGWVRVMWGGAMIWRLGGAFGIVAGAKGWASRA